MTPKKRVAPKRRDYGEGSLYQRADGMWMGVLDAGWTVDGKRKRVTVSKKGCPGGCEPRCPHRAEIKAKLRDKKKQIETDGDTGLEARATVKSWADTWLRRAERELAPKSYANTATAVRKWIIPTIGHKRLELLTPADVRAVTDAQRAAGKLGSTQLRTHSVMLTMLKAAIAEGHSVPQRLLVVKPPQRGQSDRTDMSVPEATAVLEQAAALPHGSRYVAALLQGMRQGESLGLTWDQVDLDQRLIEVSWELQALPYRIRYDRESGFRVPDGFECRQLDGALHLKRPKSRAGWRVIPMVDWMHRALTHWQEIAPPSPHGLVWPNVDGTPKIAKDDDAEWYALQTAAGVHHPKRVDDKGKPRPYTIHEARHTTATLLLEAGVDPAVIIAIMGHSSILTTRSYQHIRTGPSLQALDKVAERLQLAPPVALGD